MVGGEPRRRPHDNTPPRRHVFVVISLCEVARSIQIEEDRFGVEPEMIAKLARKDCRIYEVGISYSGRTYAKGKKINWKDGVYAFYAIIKYNIRRRTP